MRYFRLIVCAVILLSLSGAASAQQDYINVYAGGGPNNVTATTAPVYTPTNVAVDSAGNVYFSSQGSNYQHRVWKVTKSTGILSIVAGTYYYGYSGDGGQATNAQLYSPAGIAVDHSGNIFIADYSNCLVREVNASTGIITTVAGISPVLACGFGGDGGPATSAHVYNPTGVAVDKNGNLFIADYQNQRIRMVSCATVTSTGGVCAPNAGQTAGDIYEVAGTSTVCSPTTGGCGDGGPATSANFYYPYGVAVDTAGNLYISDEYDVRMRRVACGTGISSCTAPAGENIGDIYTIAGDGTFCTVSPCGDGGAATSANFYYPSTLAIDNSGNLFIADQYDFKIREVSCVTTTSTGGACTPSTGQTAGDIYTVAGDGSAGFSGGDGVLATSSTLYYAIGVAVDSAGDLFIADQDNERIREVPCDVSTLACTPPAGDTAKFIYTIAGTGGTTFFGNNIPATGAELYYPTGVASDTSGNIYIADRSNCVVREVNGGTGIITTFAGTTCGYSGDGGPATSAQLNQPYKVAVDSSGDVYIADTANCVIRKVTGGTITTFAGKNVCGYSGDGGAATSAELYEPIGVAADSLGNVYIADQDNYVVRKVSGGNISTFAGNHTYGYAGDGGPATSAEFTYVLDVAVDGPGNVYIADQYNQRIRKVSTSGTISTYAGNGSPGYEGDGGLAYQTSLYYPTGVAVDGAGDLIISDYDNQRVRMVDQANVIHTIAGNGTAGFNGNDILATLAELYQPWGVAVDPSGNVYEADFQNWLIRKINALVILNSYPSSASFGTVSKGVTSDPIALTLSANGTVNIGSITPSAGFKETDDCPSTLNSGQTCTVDVTFAPTTAGLVMGSLTITYNGFYAPSLVVPLNGTGTAMSLTPTSLAFGSQSISIAVTKTITVKGATTYTSPATISGDSTDFTIASNTCTGAIASSCVIGVQFKPLSTGAKKATLVITDSDPTSPQLAGLTGTGSSYESFTPSTITFKPQIVSTTSPNTKVTFKYAGSGTLTLSSLVPSPSNYTVNTTGLSGTLCNLSGNTLLTMNQSCVFNVAFNPGTMLVVIPGTITANFTGDPNSVTQLVMNVSGTGTEVKITGSLAFGTVTPPATLTKAVTVENEGSATLTFTAPTITGTGASAYAVLPYMAPSQSTCLNSAMLGLHQTCTISVQFTPPAGSGVSFNADLNVNDNGGASPQLVVITGKN